jgi:hypothetical protein
MEDIIREEFIQFGEKFRDNNVKEFESHQLFNLMVINVLWCVVAGTRCDSTVDERLYKYIFYMHYFRFNLNDKEQQERLEEMEKVFSEFGPASTTFLPLVLLPEPITKALGVGREMKEKYANFYSFFKEAYVEHEKTYDQNHMRDFLDVYMSERMRVTEQGIKGSSFYGEAGHWNYLNSMFDLFLVR